jgi:hypothetical protein
LREVLGELLKNAKNHGILDSERPIIGPSHVSGDSYVFVFELKNRRSEEETGPEIGLRLARTRAAKVGWKLDSAADEDDGDYWKAVLTIPIYRISPKSQT